MKSIFLSFFFMILVASSPLGDRLLISRHNSGVPLLNARTYALRSNLQAPPSCASGVKIPPSVPSGAPAVVPSVASDANSTDISFDPTTLSPNATDGGVTSDANITTTDVSLDPTASDSAAVPDATSTATDSLNSTDTSAANVTDASLSRRFAQLDLPDLALAWQNLCFASGGDIFTNDPCVELAGLGGINALLANANPCDQQDVADAMIDFARSEGVINSDELIAFAIQYRQHPRNALNILGVVPSSPYCLVAPRNPELFGIYNSQVDGVVPGLYGGPNVPIVPFGEDGTCPFGMTPDVSTCSCLPSDTSVSSDALNSTDIPDVNGVMTDGLNGTDVSLDGGDGLNSTDTSLDSGDFSDSGSSNTTSTDATSTATADFGNSTDASNSTDTSSSDSEGDDTDAPTSSSTDSGDVSTATETSDASSTESANTEASATATATEDTATEGAASSTDTAVVNANTGVPDVNDPAGR